MSTTKTKTTLSPFHAGELEAQRKAGTRGVALELAVCQRPTLSFSSNHDAFLASQSFAVVTSVDTTSDNQVWVTPLFGKEGDITAMSESTILISPACIPVDDFLHQVIVAPATATDTPLSMLGIDLAKRIRHRINGVSSSSRESSPDSKKDHLQFMVKEYSPNCPKYINRREIIPGQHPINREAIRHERTELTESDKELIARMDTLWIGTHAPGVGADTNHRGGKPGFITTPDATTLVWPEYRGNGMFFTSGNLEVNDKCGVTLFDFELGSMIQMTGHAVVDWNHQGNSATRKITFDIEKIVRTDAVTDHRWKLLDYSPYNPSIGGQVDDEGTTTVTLAKIVAESPNVKTFRWVAPRQIAFLPGQYATFEFHDVPGAEGTEVRTWTLSETPNSIHGDMTLDITVKRMPHGLVTNWLHDHAQIGLQVKLKGVQGDMCAVRLDATTKKAVIPEHLLLVSAGIGITPNLAMVRGVGAFGLNNATQITMIHVERHEADIIGQRELQRRASSYPSFSYRNVISSKEGRLTRERLVQMLTSIPMDQQEAYICGPTKFMSDITDSLVALGVPANRIHTESFAF